MKENTDKKAFYELAADTPAHIHFSRDFNNRTVAHFHNSMEILMVRSGKQRVRVGGEERVLSAGEMAVSDGYDVHSYSPEGDSEVYVLLVEKRYLHDFRACFERTFERFLGVSEGTEKIFALVERAYESGVERNPLVAQGFVTLLLGLMTEYYEPTRKRSEREELGVRILTYIDAHCGEDLHLTDLAQEFGYTPNYFSGVLYKYTGATLRDYLNRVRLEKAFQMQASGMSVTKAALACGFGSLNTYYRALKKEKP